MREQITTLPDRDLGVESREGADRRRDVDESHEVVANQSSRLAKLLGIPYLPITPTILPLPLPAKCSIYFGEPLLFEGSGDEDPENYTNRAPHPALHLLRESSVARAIAGHKASAEIPARNAERLRAMGLREVRLRLEQCREKM